MIEILKNIGITLLIILGIIISVFTIIFTVMKIGVLGLLFIVIIGLIYTLVHLHRKGLL
jgi:hypothetical protein